MIESTKVFLPVDLLLFYHLQGHVVLPPLVLWCDLGVRTMASDFPYSCTSWV